MKTTFGFCAALVVSTSLTAQFNIQKGAPVYLQPGSEIVLQGDLESFSDVSGKGTIVFQGSQLQSLNLHGKQLSSINILNASHVQLGSDLAITDKVLMSRGNLLCYGHELHLMDDAVVEGGNSDAYIETADKGNVIKHLAGNISGYLIPVGNSHGYTPLLIHSEGKYNNAAIALSAHHGVPLNKPAEASHYIRDFWRLERSGITGTVRVAASYNDVAGDDRQLIGQYWNGNLWSAKETSLNASRRMIEIAAPEGKGEIYAFESRLLTGEKDVIFPNPVQSVATLWIESDEAGEQVVLILDSKGRVLQSKKIRVERGSNMIKLDVSTMRAGHYSVTLLLNGKSKVIKMVKS